MGAGSYREVGKGKDSDTLDNLNTRVSRSYQDHGIALGRFPPEFRGVGIEIVDSETLRTIQLEEIRLSLQAVIDTVLVTVRCHRGRPEENQQAQTCDSDEQTVRQTPHGAPSFSYR
jgi:hypothetical protein